MRCAWLFDETINAYMWLLQERDRALCAADPARLPTYFFSSFFFEKLFENSGEYNYGSVKRWSKKVTCTNGNVFKLGKMVVPVNVGGAHWCLAVAHVAQRRVQYYDSMGGGGLRYLSGLKRFFLDEAKKYPGDAVAASVASWAEVPTQVWADGGACVTPQQDNGVDCGVFTCYFANYVSADKAMAFSAHNMPLFRRRLTLDILNKAVL
jgi:sentrin-specific protease 1